MAQDMIMAHECQSARPSQTLSSPIAAAALLLSYSFARLITWHLNDNFPGILLHATSIVCQSSCYTTATSAKPRMVWSFSTLQNCVHTCLR